MIKLAGESFDNITSNGITLVVFGSDWCGDCRVAKPITEELASKYENIITVAELNIDDEKEIAKHYDIKSIPTFILFKDGCVVSRNDNVRQVEVLENMIEVA